MWDSNANELYYKLDFILNMKIRENLPKYKFYGGKRIKIVQRIFLLFSLLNIFEISSLNSLYVNYIIVGSFNTFLGVLTVAIHGKIEFS